MFLWTGSDLYDEPAIEQVRMSREDVEGLLARYDIRLDPNLDQQHLIDDRLLEEMVDLADIKNTEIVLEVGAGCGNITELLAERAWKVYAIEKSQKFLPVLKHKLENCRDVHIIIGDALDIEFPRFDKIVSNLPYSICEGLMQRLVHHDFRVGVLILPLSFARKIAASPDDPGYSKLTLMVSFFYDAQIEAIIKPDAYFPAPKVYTALVRLTPRVTADLRGQLIRGLFLQRDMKTKNVLKNALIAAHGAVLKAELTKREARKIVESFNIDPRLMNRRVARMSLEEVRDVIDKIPEKLSH